MKYSIFKSPAVNGRSGRLLLSRFYYVFVVLASVASMTACGAAGVETQSVAASVVPVSLVIAAPTAAQAVGDTQQFSATATFSDHTSREVTAQSTWFSSASSIATIGASSGFETAVAPGDTTISVTFAAAGIVVRASAAVHVKSNIVSLLIEPTTAQVELGANQQFTATATLDDGSTRDVSRSALWSSSDDNVLRMNTTPGRIGVGNTRGAGRVTVTATVDGIARSTSVSVTRRVPKFLYVAGIDGINGYSISPSTGVLAPVAGSQFTAAGAISSLAVSRDRRFLYAADVVLGVIWGFNIDPSGAVVALRTSPFFTAATSSPTSLVADPAADFLFMTDVDTGDITTFTIAPDGSLAALNPTTPVGLQPLLATTTPDGKFVYQGLHLGSSAFISAFSVGADGVLSPLSGPAVPTGFLPRTLTVDPSGQFLYAAIPSSSLGRSTSVFAYSIDAVSGALAPIGNAPFSAGESPVSLATDPSGRFLYVANSANSIDGNSISGFAIDFTTGDLTNVPGTLVPAVPSPAVVAVDPGGQFVYAGLSDGQGVRAFTIDQATGDLTEIPGSRVPALGPIQSIAITY